ncbi:hypothetical protein C8R45DRAFT_1089907 [Mycena sanguinolenta]|nr:hypothetical protein C8R45DRAFT_1089907 [Mycena sanguinolenta]
MSMRTINLWIAFDGKMRKIISVPLDTIQTFCKYPVKWVFFVACVICDGKNRGTLYKIAKNEDESMEDENEDVNDHPGMEGERPTLRLQKVPDDQMRSEDIMTDDYFFIGPKKFQFIDPLAMDDRRSDSEIDQRIIDFRPRVILRDHACVVCGEQGGASCVAAHIIPPWKGNEYLQNLNRSRRVKDRMAVSDLDSPQNAMFIGRDMYNRMKVFEVAFLPVGTGHILQDDDVPSPVFPWSRALPEWVPLSDLDKDFVMKRLGKDYVEAALHRQDQDRAQAKPSNRRLIFQHLADIHDIHIHNTRVRTAVDPTDWPPPYLLEFQYVASIIGAYGNPSSLHHDQPLVADPYIQPYYGSFRHISGRAGFGPALRYKIIHVDSAPEEESTGHDGEENMDEGDRDSSGDEDLNTEDKAKAVSRYTHKRTEEEAASLKLDPDAGPPPMDPFDFLLCWSSHKPLLSREKIEDWRREVTESGE